MSVVPGESRGQPNAGHTSARPYTNKDPDPANQALGAFESAPGLVVPVVRMSSPAGSLPSELVLEASQLAIHAPSLLSREKGALAADLYIHILLMYVLADLLLVIPTGQFQVIGPEEPIQALVGEDVIFSCHVSPKMSLEDMEVRFFRNQFSSILLLYKDGREIQKSQMQEYQERTQFVQVVIVEGKLSLKLKNITLSDSGIYGCWFSSQTFYQQYTWELKIAALGSSPLISLKGYRDRKIFLICQSAGWFPRPEVQWKNHQGQSLSSDFKANTKDNGLFDIETSLVIQKPSTGDISCSIRIWGFRQESRVKIADEFFQPSPWSYAFSIMMTFFLILVASGIFLHRHQVKLKEELEWRIKMGKEGWKNAAKHAVEVTLDPETAHPKLHISQDCKKVNYANTVCYDIPETEKRFQSPSVVASQGFSTGECYWEVEVGKKNRWYLGVCWDDVDRKQKEPLLSPANGYWVLGRWNQHEHFTFSPSRQSLTFQVQPERVGIFLNCKYQQISFFNVTDKSHIYTFTGCDFNKKILRPYFRPRSNDINEYNPTLVICTNLTGIAENDTSPSNSDYRGKAVISEE
ncbi:butyrophilin-like protein 3 [Dromiciops gliroides]|uniref:butyrophilin-like protein 3 n=1 Tax=Dromiciops gliroides TaxID=33562 RepID=UPI001CC6C34A|nr:butyrophilin-like protein 3 [Dromiciops gliroides]